MPSSRGAGSPPRGRPAPATEDSGIAPSRAGGSAFPGSRALETSRTRGRPPIPWARPWSSHAPAARLLVGEGHQVNAGDPITEGTKNPHMLLKVLGREAAQLVHGDARHPQLP